MPELPGLGGAIALRRQLLELRGQALAALIRDGAAEPEMLALLSSTAAAIAALDRLPAASGPVSRAVVAGDGPALRLIVFDRKARGAALSLTPAAAIDLAGELLKAAALRQAVEEDRAPGPRAAADAPRRQKEEGTISRARPRAPRA